MSELSADAKDLIEQSRLEDGPRPSDKDRLRARLAAQLGAGAFGAGVGTASLAASAELSHAAHGAGAGAGHASVSGTSALLAKWAAGALVAAGLSWAVVAALPGAPAAPKPDAPAAIAAHPGPSPSPAPQPAALPDAASAPPSDARELPAPGVPEPRRDAARKRRARAVRTIEPVGARGDMSAELALLSQAQKALRARDGAEALRLARQHAQSFPAGALYEERAGIEALAHCLLGERDHAAVRAFLARAGSSPLGVRVRKECGSP